MLLICFYCLTILPFKIVKNICFNSFLDKNILRKKKTEVPLSFFSIVTLSLIVWTIICLSFSLSFFEHSRQFLVNFTHFSILLKFWRILSLFFSYHLSILLFLSPIFGQFHPFLYTFLWISSVAWSISFKNQLKKH